MEITTDYTKQAQTEKAAPPLEQTQSQTEKQPQQIKLSPGDTVKGEILDIKQAEVTVRLDSGEVITGRLSSPIDAKIGQFQIFKALFDENGTLALEMKEIPQALVQKGVITEALLSFNLKPTENNLKLSEILINNQIPFSKESIQKLNQALKLMGGEFSPENIKKALYLLENNINITPKNVQTLSGFTEGQIKLSSQLANLVNELSTLPETETVNLIKNILINGEAALPDGEIIKNAMAKFENLPANSSSLQNTIAFAFESAPLTLKGFQKLAGELIKKYPEQKTFVESLLQTKQEFADKIIEQRPQLLHNINEITAKTSNPPPEAFSKIFENLREDAGAKSQIKFIYDILGIDKPEKTDAKTLLQKLAFRLENSKNPKEIDAFLNELNKNIETSKQVVQRSEMPEAPKLLESMSKISNNLEFVATSKQNLFAQIPLAVLGREANAELLVFRDKNKKAQKGNKASALIALDTLNLGRFEVYVQKDSNSVICQFRLENEGVEKLVRENIGKLQELLEQKNYTLSNYCCNKLTEPFNLMEKEPDSSKQEANLLTGRISLDIRA